MSKEEIDEWLYNEYGTSYTRLEELLEYFFEKYTDQKEEIERLNNIINELEKWLKYEINKSGFEQDYERKSCYEDIFEELQELKGGDKK